MGTGEEPQNHWKDAWTLEDYVIDLFRRKQTGSLEFQLLLRIYGRERLVAIWNQYQDHTSQPG